jgi:hypothetical protein
VLSVPWDDRRDASIRPPAMIAWKQPALVFGIALAVRLVHLWQMRDAPVFSVLMGDARGYNEWAQTIAGGQWLGTDCSIRRRCTHTFSARSTRCSVAI